MTDCTKEAQQPWQIASAMNSIKMDSFEEATKAPRRVGWKRRVSEIGRCELRKFWEKMKI